MVQALHPEMTDLTAGDIKILTLSPVILNGQYNDLALLVRDKLIIFVEAQSTWSINIIVRILLYLADTYYEYIHDHEFNVYSSTPMTLPEPEFYVIYTGTQKVDSEIISLREDFWHNPDAKIDLQVKVICAENKSDVIGQYIIFCHVLDEQIKIHGRKKKAAEEAIRICQDIEVLRAYLESRKKEVIGIMKLLFDQDYAMQVAMKEQRRQTKIETTVEMCQRFGKSILEAVRMLSVDFSLTQEDAAKYVQEFWKS